MDTMTLTPTKRGAPDGLRVQETICWDCSNAHGRGCCWFTDHLPIPGWSALCTDIDCNDAYRESFRVQNCPLFAKGKVNRKRT